MDGCLYYLLRLGDSAAKVALANRKFYADVPAIVIAVDERGAGKRAYSSNFADGYFTAILLGYHQAFYFFFCITKIFLVSHAYIKLPFALVQLCCGFAANRHLNNGLSI